MIQQRVAGALRAADVGLAMEATVLEPLAAIWQLAAMAGSESTVT